MSIIFLLILLYSFFKPIGYLIALVWAFQSFGALTAIPTDWSGGVSLLIATIAQLILVIRVFSSTGIPNRVQKLLLDPRRLGFLTLFTIVAVVGAICLPRLFSGQIYVFPLRASVDASLREPVSYSTANLTQGLYITISYLVVCSYAILTQTRAFFDDFRNALIAGAFVYCLSGGVDIIFNIAGMGDILDVFRTASYSFLVDVEAANVRRVVGLMPEASAFGGWGSGLGAILLFTRHAFQAKTRDRIVLPLAVACTLLAALSTSSTAYGVLLVVVALYGFDNGWRLAFGSSPVRARAGLELLWLGLIVLIGFCSLLFLDGLRNTILDVLDQMVFQKTSSSSYEERSLWTLTAFEAWQSSLGLGIGVGSVRTSNFFVNILASTGAIGFALFSAFLGRVFLADNRLGDPELNELVWGLKLAIIPGMVGSALAGTTPDYGGVSGAIFGTIVGFGWRPRGKLR